MKIKDWKPGMAVSIVGAVNFRTATERGKTTKTPPVKAGNITRVEVELDSGVIRNVSIGRLNIDD